MHTARSTASPPPLSWLLLGLGLGLGLAEPSAQSAKAPATTDEGGSLLVFFGTYTSARSKGIYVSRLDRSRGTLSEPELAAEVASPAFLALHPNGQWLYAVNEVGGSPERPAGGVSAFAIDRASGRLTLLNQASSGGAGPCHLTVVRTGRAVLVANYGGGSVAALPLRDDGRLGEPMAVIQHQGSSVNPQRQAGPHAHGIYVDPANRVALVPDLGLDRVLSYRIDPATGDLTAHDPPFAPLAAGSGPRHLTFHPDGRHVYVINELLSTITRFAYDAGRGALSARETVSTLPEGWTGTNSTAEIAAHPSGKFLYGSNRGHDSLAIYAVDAPTGRLRLTGHQATLGKTPRNFGIDPTGTFLLAANQGSDSVVAFRIDAATGQLTPTGQTLTVGSPVCVVFLKP
jgi:6-phosphogluconolactonase